MTSPETFSEKFRFSSWGVSGDAGRDVFSVVVAPHWEQLSEKDVDLSSVWLHEFKHVFVVHLLLCNDLSAHFFTFFFLFWSPVFRYHLRLAVCFSEFFFFDSSTLVSLSWSESASHFTPPETSLTIAARSFISQPPTSSSCPQRLLFSPHLSPSLVSFLR